MASDPSARADSGTPADRWHWLRAIDRVRWLGLVAASGLAATLAAWAMSAARIEAVEAARFESHALRQVQALRAAIERQVEAARAVAGLLHAIDTIDPLAFRRFADSMALAARPAALVGINFAAYVTPEQWPAFAQRLRQDAAAHPSAEMRAALARMQPWPASARDRLWPVVLVAPSDPPAPPALAVIGFDLGTGPARRLALERARDSGAVTLSPAIPIDVRPGAERDGLALRAPVYRAGMALDTVEQRRAAMRGIVSVVMRIQPLFTQRGDDGDALPMRLQVRDLDSSDGPALLYDSTREREDSPVPAAAAAYKTEIELHGRRWAMLFQRLQAEPAWLAPASLIVLAGGLGLTGLLAAAAHLLLRQRGAAEAATRRMHDETRRNAQALRSMFDSATDAIVAVVEDGTVADCNPAAQALFGRDRDALLGQPFEALLPGLHIATPEGRLDVVGAEGGKLASTRVQAQARDASGALRPVSLAIGRMHIEGRPCLTLSLSDLTLQRAAQAKAQEFDRFGLAILECAPCSMMLVRLDGCITGANQATEKLLGYTRDELRDQSPRLFHDPAEVLDRAAKLSQALGHTVLPGPELFFLQHERLGLEESDWTYVRKDGSRVPVAVSVARLLDDHGHHVGSVRVSVDISERVRAADHIRHLAAHDALTGLGNRSSLQMLLGEAVARAHAGSQGLALMFVDLDGFKRINDTLGHDAGDQLLKTVAQRLRGAVRTSDTVARMGGDEFVVLLPGIGTAREAGRVADKIIDVLLQPCEVADARAAPTEVSIGASIGIALYPDDATDGEGLLRLADKAMYRAKRGGRSTWRSVGEPGADTQSGGLPSSTLNAISSH